MKYYLNIKTKDIVKLECMVNHALKVGFNVIGPLQTISNNQNDTVFYIEFLQTMLLDMENKMLSRLEEKALQTIIYDLNPSHPSSKIIEIIGYTDRFLFVVLDGGKIEMMDENYIKGYYGNCFYQPEKNKLSSFEVRKDKDSKISLYSLTVKRFEGDEGFTVRDCFSKIEALVNIAKYFEV